MEIKIIEELGWKYFYCDGENDGDMNISGSSYITLTRKDNEEETIYIDLDDRTIEFNCVLNELEIKMLYKLLKELE